MCPRTKTKKHVCGKFISSSCTGQVLVLFCQEKNDKNSATASTAIACLVLFLHDIIQVILPWSKGPCQEIFYHYLFLHLAIWATNNLFKLVLFDICCLPGLSLRYNMISRVRNWPVCQDLFTQGG